MGKSKVITRTPSKIIIQHGELARILNKTEIQQWHNIIEKIRLFDEKEKERLGLINKCK